jgi:hypothetical protein
MIGSERHDNGVTVAPGRKCGACENRRSRIAPDRLEKNIGLHGNRRELLSNKKTIPRIGDDDRATEQCRIGNSAKCLLKCRMPTK